MLSSPSLPLPLFQIHHHHSSPLPSSPHSPPFASKEAPKSPIHNTPHKRTLKPQSLPSQNPSFSTNPQALPHSPQSPEEDFVGSFRFRRYDLESFAAHLKSCFSLKQVRCAHAVAIRRFDRCAPFVANNLISAYVRFRELWDARKVFDGMPERNVVSWTAVLNGYLNMGLDDEVLILFREMIYSDVDANGLTFVCLLKFCGNRLDVGLGKQVHACVLKGRWNNLIVDSALVYFYSRCGDLLGAFKVFDKMPDKDVVCWTTMITAYVQRGLVDEAFLMFSSMQYHGFHPNEFTVCGVLKACGEIKDLRLGKQLHGAVAKGLFRQDVYVGSSLVNMYVRCGEVLDARTVFDLMPKRNTITWTSMISGYAQSGFGKEAISLFQRMKRRRVFVNNQTVVSVLSACGSIGSLCLGKEVHAQIIKNLVLENIHIGSTLIWFYCKCGEYNYAAKILESMPARDVISWTAMISGYSSLGYGSEALKLLNDMLWDNVRPNMFTYSSALKACARLEDVNNGKWIHACVSKAKALENVFVGSSLIDMYMRCGDVADALRVFDEMPDRNSVTWKVMVVGYAKNGRCKEALKLLYRMQEEGFDVDDFVLATVLSACGDVQWETERTSTCCLISGCVNESR